MAANASANGGSGTAPHSPELAAVTARRSLSSGDPAAIPFGGSIPEGGPFTPTMVPASSLPSPFANSLQAVSAGGILSLGAMQQQQAAAAAAAAGLYPGVYPAQAPRQSDNSSLTGSTADASNSMHSTTSDGQQQAAAMAGTWLMMGALFAAGVRGQLVCVQGHCTCLISIACGLQAAITL